MVYPRTHETPLDSITAMQGTRDQFNRSRARRTATTDRSGPRFQILRRRIVARIDRLRQEALLVISPELADIRVGLDDGVDELSAFALALADEDITNNVAEAVEANRAARRVEQRYVVQRFRKCLAIIGLAADLLDGSLDTLAGDVHAGRIAARKNVVVSLQSFDQALVAGRIAIGRVPRRRNHPDCFVAKAAQQGIIHCGPAGEERNAPFQAKVRVGAHELHRIRSGKPVEDAVHLADLGDVGRVVGRQQRRPQLLHHATAVVLEHPLKAGHLLMAEREILRDRGGTLVLELLGGVVAYDVATLRGRGRGTDHEWIGLALGDVLGRRQTDQWRLVVADVVRDGQQLEGGERPQDHVDLVALDQLLRLGLGARRIAAGVSRDELDPAPRQRVALLLEQRRNALLHLNPALGQRPGLDREQPELEWGLGVRIGRPQRRDPDASSGEALEHFPTMDCHRLSSFWSPCWAACLAPSMTWFRAARYPPW